MLETALCKHYESGYCRSCALLHLPYLEQLKVKDRKITERFSGITPNINPIVPAESPLGSRARVKLAVGGSTESPLIGFPNERGEITHLLDCPLQNERLNQIVQAVPSLITKHGIAPYSVANRTGELKYVILKCVESTGETLLRLVVRSRVHERRLSEMSQEISSMFPAIEVATLNIQPEHKAVFEGAEDILLTATCHLVDDLNGMKLALTPQAFTQVTPSVAVKLYEKAAKYVQSAKSERLLDLYCGVGAFAIFSAKFVKRGLGIELSADAVEAAKRSLVLNGINNLEFESSSVEDALIKHRDFVPDMIVVNPPRRGLNNKIIAELLRMKPQSIIYSSCSPETLERDLWELLAAYEVKELTPFDMFPFTEHVEVLVCLKRR